MIRGDIEFDTTELGDFVIAKSLEEPIFHFVVVLDDYLMGVTHVIRGEDHISNTPRQILIQQALGAPTPFYAHLPLVLGADRAKLSKRKGALPLTEYRSRGYLPQAVLNFISLLGWNPGTEQELFSLEELVQVFDLSKVQKGGAVFNDEKLAWFNKQYIAKLSPEEFITHVKEYAPEVAALPAFTKIVPLLHEKITSFADIRTLLAPGGELAFMTVDFGGSSTGSALPYDSAALLWKGETDVAKVKASLKKVIELVSTLPGTPTDFSADAVKNAVWDFASSIPKEQGGKGSVLWPMRYALSGQQKSPDPFIISEILGKDETLARLNRAYNAL
jgi:glutamyl/glutaminyl-tRNA synthetase